MWHMSLQPKGVKFLCLALTFIIKYLYFPLELLLKDLCIYFLFHLGFVFSSDSCSVVGFTFVCLFYKFFESPCAALRTSVWSGAERWGGVWEKQTCSYSCWWLLKHPTHSLQQAVCCLGRSTPWNISVSISWATLHPEFKSELCLYPYPITISDSCVPVLPFY